MAFKAAPGIQKRTEVHLCLSALSLARCHVPHSDEDCKVEFYCEKGGLWTLMLKRGGEDSNVWGSEDSDVKWMLLIRDPVLDWGASRFCIF